MLNRPRRNRRSPAIRSLLRETTLLPEQLVLPLFLVEGENVEEEIASLPGTCRRSADRLLDFVGESLELGLKSFILFPAVDEKHKNRTASYASRPDNFYLRAAEAVKAQYPQCCLISDVAMDPYSSDGHDGLVKDGRILNDETLPILCEMGLAQARAGFDYLGPSDMMDGRVQALREALDDEGFSDTGILAYTAKYASAFYGPFRDALDSAPREDANIPKDKQTYQMDPANKREALLEAELDELEGADLLMVKPALHYLDVIHLLREQSELPIAAYHVSGECAMLLAAARNGWLAYEQAMPETLLSLRRAGADVILTYFAYDYARMYKDGLLGV